MNDFTNEDFDTLYYRKKKLRSAAQSLMDLISGNSIKINPYMENEDGQYSEERTLATVEELLEALKTYLRFERSEKIYENGDYDAEPMLSYYEMSDDEIACYRGFLYCALRDIYAADDHRKLMENKYYRRVFGDLIELAKGEHVFSSYQDFLRSRYLEGIAPFPQIDFLPMTDESTDALAQSLDLLAKLSDPSYRVSFQAFYMATDEEMEQMLQSLTVEQREEVDRRMREYEEMQEAERHMWKYIELSELDLYEPSMEEIEIQEEIDRRIRDAERRYVRNFVYTDSYREHLSQYLHLQHLREDGASFLDAITGMVDFFLLAKGQSCFGDANSFYKTIARLHHITQQTAAETRRKER